MFVGSVPKECIEQARRVCGVDTWGDVFVCCSGSFRVDKALALAGARVHSNDVALLSCAIGAFLMGRDLDFRFGGALECLRERSESFTGLDRVALVGLALQMSAFTKDNTFAKHHFEHYRSNLDFYLDRAKVKVATHLDGFKIASYFGGDFREHARNALEAGGGVVAFPPTYKKGYERMYRVLHESTEWSEPNYDVWDPKDIGDWVRELAVSPEARYCVFSDQLLEGLKPVSEFLPGRNKPVYFYASTTNSSVRAREHKSTAFKYTPIAPDRLRVDSKVTLVEADAGMMNFLKDKYLKAGLAHSTGSINLLVMVDGMLVGGFIYTRGRFGGSDLYLLSDFALDGRRRLAKLVALLATSKTAVRIFEKRYLERAGSITTTAFTDKPISMKYRGVFELTSRKPGFLQYASKVRDARPDELYAEWWRKFGSKPERPTPAD